MDNKKIERLRTDAQMSDLHPDRALEILDELEKAQALLKRTQIQLVAGEDYTLDADIEKFLGEG